MKIQTQLFVLTAAMAATGFSTAQEVGRVISSTPILQQVGVPRQVCGTEEVEVQRSNSGAGAAIGAIAGAALGSASGGRGAGRVAATMIGAIGGAVLGDRIEGEPESRLQSVQRCGTQTNYENRVVAYSVVYEYGGRQFTVQMPNDPGPTLALQISPVGANTYSAPPVYVQPRTVVVQQPVYAPYPVYYPRTYYPPVRLDLNLGYGGGYGQGHWRGHRDGPYWR